jgi:hypothetical protein
MFYDPPHKWTEDLVDELPFGEDDRYERKSGAEISKQELESFSKKLAKEIGAFANSFGGTLFIGVADDNSKVGVPSIAKGRTPTDRWLENIIPALFELRLQHFRISRVELSPNTQSLLGNDRLIIAIDVYHSELAPHQCVFDHRYYYRSNSESRPAPHHYLAFLWGRTNSNMSRVATWWIKDFLKPLIDLLGDIQKEFNQNTFLLESIPVQIHSHARINRIDFFSRETWEGLLSSDVGEYFLSTFPLIHEAVTSFGENISEFDKALNRLEKSIEDSPFLLNQLIDFYENMIRNERIPRRQYENSNLQEITQLILGQLHLQISHYPAEGKDNLVRLIAYTFLGLNLTFPMHALPDESVLLSVSKDIANELKSKDDSITKSLEQTKQIFEIVKSTSSNIWERLRKDRKDIAQRYTATFGQ